MTVAAIPAAELREVFRIHRTSEGDAAALQGATLSVARGEVLCVLGPSGAGKTTLLRVLAGLEPPSAGEVLVAGENIGRLGRRAAAALRRARIGFLEQRAEQALAPDVPAALAVALGLVLRGVRVRAGRERAAQLLAQVGLADRGAALPGELSGGERQRVALCAALAHRPELLLADEPTGELDEQAGVAVLSLMTQLARREGASIVVVSHDEAVAAAADRVVELRDGRILAPPLPAAATADAPALVTWRPARVELAALTRLHPGRSAAVLDALSVMLAPGSLTVVRGRSGSGKTTLLRALAGLDRPDAGDVVLDGRSLAALDAEQLAALRRERIGYLEQEPAPVPFLSAAENVALALALRGWQQEAARRRAAVVLSQVGLADRAHQRVGRLSAGETQRVGLARALAGARGLLIVDEPTSRLDDSNAVAVAALLAAAAGRHTVVCATHDARLIAHADELIEL